MRKSRKAHSLKMIAFTIWLEYFCQSLFAIIKIWKIVNFAMIEKKGLCTTLFLEDRCFLHVSLFLVCWCCLTKISHLLSFHISLLCTKNLPEFFGSLSCKYRRVISTNTFCLEPQPMFSWLFMKGKCDVYVLWNFTNNEFSN